MKSACLLLAGACLTASVSVSYAQYFPQHRWSHRAGDSGTDVAYGIATDGLDIGNHPIVVGSFEGTIDLGGGPLTSAGSTDVFAVVYDREGNHVWSRRFGGPGADVAYGAVAQTTYLGGGNYAYEFTVTGAFEDTVSFGGNDLASAGGRDGFVARLDGTGSHVWSVRFGDVGDDVGRAITLASSHGVIVTGAVTDAGLGTTDMWIAGYDAAGTQQWSHTYGGPLDDVGRAIAGGIVTGEFRGQASFGGTPLVSAGGSDIFVARYDAAGAHVWSKQFGGTQDDAGLSVDTYGFLLCTGYFRGTVNFGGSNLTSAGGEDIFLLKLDFNGVHQYSRRYGGTGNDAGAGVKVSSTSYNDIELVGRFENSVNLGHNTLTSAGGSDGFLAIINDTGLNKRNVRMGGSGDDVANAICHYAYLQIPESSSYEVAIAGAFMNTMDLGGGPLVSAGGADAFVVDYSETWLTPVGPALPGDRPSIASYPNPFNPLTTIRYFVPTDGALAVTIYNVNGERVATLVNSPHHRRGAYEVRWEGRADDGAPVASGVYFAQLEHDGVKQTARLVMLK